MAIDTSQTLPTPAATAAPVNPNSVLGKDAFMKLLVAQLKNQDPLSPTDSKEMVAQLAQLTSVEKLSGIDEKLSALQRIQSGSSALQNAGLIGHRVDANSNNMALTSTAAGKGRFELQGAADSVEIKIRDSAGALVRTLELGPQAFGTKKFEWDGMNEQGTRAVNGDYSFEIAAKNAAGHPVVTSTRVSGLVTGVTFESGTSEVIVGGARIPLGDVTSISQ